MSFICKQCEVILSPNFLILLEESRRHDHWILLLLVLELPPSIITVSSPGKFGQLATMDASRLISKLLVIGCDHLCPSFLV